jgi:hypothetical protein
MTISIRMMYRDPDHDLHGYVFTDVDHAQQWLRQTFVKRSDIRLEVVEVGELHICPKCHGSGSTQSIRITSKITVHELLGEMP